MNLIEIVLIAVVLSIDAMVAASVSCAACAARNGRARKEAAVLSISFALFQGGMALVGWSLGVLGERSELFFSYAHAIAFLLLAVVGGKMIGGGWKSSREDGVRHRIALSLRRVFALSLATSVDAGAVGVSLALANRPIALAAVVIGVVTLLLTWLGALFGEKIGPRVKGWGEIVGGILLIGIGLRIFFSPV